MAAAGMKPYVKLASTLVVVGMGLFSAEQIGLGRFAHGTTHLNGLLISAMVLVPLGLVASGAIVFVYGKMRRL